MAKFYTASTFAAISNTNWEGDISNIGDKVVIQNIPDIAISNYVVGAGLTYQAPTPGTIELTIDKGKSFAFQLNDLLAMQPPTRGLPPARTPPRTTSALKALRSRSRAAPRWPC